MQCTLKIANQSSWEQLLVSSDHSYAHFWEFGQTLAQAYQEYEYCPTIFEFEDGLQAALPLIRVHSKATFVKCYESMPFSLGGAPLWLGGTSKPEHFQSLLGALKPDRLLLNGAAGYDLSPSPNLSRLETRQRKTHVLDLKAGFDFVWEKSFEGKVRNQCRRAHKKGVEVSPGSSTEDYKVYYEMYCEATKAWGYDSPPYPESLFQAFAQCPSSPVELLLARIEGEVAAGIIMFQSKSATMYWASATRKQFSGYSPNNRLLEVAIRQSCQDGKRLFDFGGSEGLDSVRRYKESFGAQAVIVNDLVYSTRRFRMLEGARKIIRRGNKPIEDKLS